MAPLRSFTSLRRYVGSGDDWRQGVWNRWLVSYLTPRDEELGEPPGDGESPADPSAPEGLEASSGTAALEPDEATGAGVGAGMEAGAEEPNPSEESGSMGRRQTAARARLEALGEQMYAIEDTLDALRQRLQVRDATERRAAQRMMQLVERMVDAVERQSEVLEHSIVTLERVERRLAQVDRWVRPAGTESIPPSAAPSGIVGLEGRLAARLSDDSGCAPSTSGSLSDMSLATLLSMFELERRTGWLTLEGERDRARFELLDGSVVNTAFNERSEDPVEVLRSALRWRTGSFSFRHVPVEACGAAVRSVGELLLEASRQNDEHVHALD